MPDHLQALSPGVRAPMTADDLGIGVIAQSRAGHGSTAPDAPSLQSDNPMVALVDRLSKEFGGVIFTGPPGTSKSFVAAEVGRLIAGDESRLWFVQFHASYQYEDFMYGFVPRDDGMGFEARRGPFLEACRAASADPSHRYVLVIDELSRADVGRVFGEALTYVERSKRELEFTIAAGPKWKVPSNLVILATMNPQDRGVDEVDAAFERRFAKVAMNPDHEALEEILVGNEVEERLRARIVQWFRRINGQAKKNPTASVGHAYFINVVDEVTLKELWDHQLKFLVDRAFRLDRNTGAEIEAAWERIFASDPAAEASSPGGEQNDGTAESSSSNGTPPTPQDPPVGTGVDEGLAPAAPTGS